VLGPVPLVGFDLLIGWLIRCVRCARLCRPTETLLAYSTTENMGLIALAWCGDVLRSAGAGLALAMTAALVH